MTTQGGYRAATRPDAPIRATRAEAEDDERAWTCRQEHICGDGASCWVCDEEDDGVCPDCSEKSRCGACQDDYEYTRAKDER